MIWSHAVYTRSFGIREIVQTVKRARARAFQLSVLYKPYQPKIVPEKAKFAFFIEGRLEACHFPSANLAMAGKNISTIKHAQHFISHCSFKLVDLYSEMSRAVFRGCINELIQAFLCHRGTESEKFSVVLIEVINFVNEVYGFLTPTIGRRHLSGRCSNLMRARSLNYSRESVRSSWPRAFEMLSWHFIIVSVNKFERHIERLL